MRRTAIKSHRSRSKTRSRHNRKYSSESSDSSNDGWEATRKRKRQRSHNSKRFRSRDTKNRRSRSKLNRRSGSKNRRSRRKTHSRTRSESRYKNRDRSYSRGQRNKKNQNSAWYSSDSAQQSVLRWETHRRWNWFKIKLQIYWKKTWQKMRNVSTSWWRNCLNINDYIDLPKANNSAREICHWWPSCRHMINFAGIHRQRFN